MAKEIWKEVEDDPDYMVSNLGRVYSAVSDRFLSIYTSSTGLSRFQTRHRKHYTLHKEVARAFLPGYHDRAKVVFVDGDPKNCAVVNLKIIPQLSTRNIIPRQNRPRGLKVRIVETGQVFDTVRDAADFVNGDYSTIYQVLKNKRYTHQGYSYEWVRDEE